MSPWVSKPINTWFKWSKNTRHTAQGQPGQPGRCRSRAGLRCSSGPEASAIPAAQGILVGFKPAAAAPGSRSPQPQAGKHTERLTALPAVPRSSSRAAAAARAGRASAAVAARRSRARLARRPRPPLQPPLPVRPRARCPAGGRAPLPACPRGAGSSRARLPLSLAARGPPPPHLAQQPLPVALAAVGAHGSGGPRRRWAAPPGPAFAEQPAGEAGTAATSALPSERRRDPPRGRAAGGPGRGAERRGPSGTCRGPCGSAWGACPGEGSSSPYVRLPLTARRCCHPRPWTAWLRWELVGERRQGGFSIIYMCNKIMYTLVLGMYC